jgi:hypothetical protein
MKIMHYSGFLLLLIVTTQVMVPMNQQQLPMEVVSSSTSSTTSGVMNSVTVPEDEIVHRVHDSVSKISMNPHANTFLECVIENKNVKVLKYMFTDCYKESYRLLANLVVYKKIRLMSAFLEMVQDNNIRFDIDDYPDGQRSLLMYALDRYCGGDQTMLKRIVQQGASLEQFVDRSDKKTVVAVLIGLGARLDHPSNERLLHVAVENAARSMVRLLLNAGARKDYFDDKGKSAVLCAYDCGYKAILELLCKAGAACYRKGSPEELLVEAIEQNDLEKATTAIHRGISYIGFNHEGRDVLAVIAERNDVSKPVPMLQLLLSKKLLLLKYSVRTDDAKTVSFVLRNLDKQASNEYLLNILQVARRYYAVNVASAIEECIDERTVTHVLSQPQPAIIADVFVKRICWPILSAHTKAVCGFWFVSYLEKVKTDVVHFIVELQKTKKPCANDGKLLNALSKIVVNEWLDTLFKDYSPEKIKADLLRNLEYTVKDPWFIKLLNAQVLQQKDDESKISASSSMATSQSCSCSSSPSTRTTCVQQAAQ